MKKIDDYLYQIEATEDDILSADIFIIKGINHNYIYDVGASTNALNELNKIDNKVIFISHFHKDHIFNIDKLKFDELYSSKYSYKRINMGKIIENEFVINDGINIEVLNIPSSHSKGSIGLNINNKYLLVGDAIYSKEVDNQKVYNVSLLYDLIKKLEEIKTEYILISHRRNIVSSKINVIKYLKSIYNMKNSASAIINL